MDIQHILVGVDFSDESRLAAQTALALAARHGSDVTLIHICELHEWPSWLDYRNRDTADGLEARLEEYVRADRDRFQGWSESVAPGERRVHQVLKRGRPDRALLDAIREMSPDLVVMGSQGLGGNGTPVLGSVVDSVVTGAECAVLVVREQEEPRDTFHRVVSASDFSDLSARALDLGRAVASGDATLDIIHCWRVPAADDMGGTVDRPPRGEDELARGVHDQLVRTGREWLAEQLRPGYVFRFQLVRHRPARGILEWVASHDCDLLVVGAEGGDGRRRCALGSVAGAVTRRAPCSVLVVR
jgi:nucleotide-binding universal stress UspA family protein